MLGCNITTVMPGRARAQHKEWTRLLRLAAAAAIMALTLACSSDAPKPDPRCGGRDLITTRIRLQYPGKVFADDLKRVHEKVGDRFVNGGSQLHTKLYEWLHKAGRGKVIEAGTADSVARFCDTGDGSFSKFLEGAVAVTEPISFRFTPVSAEVGGGPVPITAMRTLNFPVGEYPTFRLQKGVSTDFFIEPESRVWVQRNSNTGLLVFNTLDGVGCRAFQCDPKEDKEFIGKANRRTAQQRCKATTSPICGQAAPVSDVQAQLLAETQALVTSSVAANSRCSASCRAYNDNDDDHVWVKPYFTQAQGAYNACLSEAARKKVSADSLGCTEVGVKRCAAICTSATRTAQAPTAEQRRDAEQKVAAAMQQMDADEEEALRNEALAQAAREQEVKLQTRVEATMIIFSGGGKSEAEGQAALEKWRSNKKLVARFPERDGYPKVVDSATKKIDGLKPGYFVVVPGIYAKKADAKKTLKAIKRYQKKGVYLKKVKVDPSLIGGVKYAK